MLVREQEWNCQSYNILNQRKHGIIMILLHEVVHTEFWSNICNVRKTTLQAHHVFIHCVDKQNMDMNFYDMTLAFVLKN